MMSVLDIMKREGIGGIYVFQNPSDQSVKIGWSGNVSARYETSKTWVPNIIWMADTFGFGHPQEERAIHKLFSCCRINSREWFRLTPLLAFYIWDNFGIRTLTESLLRMLNAFAASKMTIGEVVDMLPEYDGADVGRKVGELKTYLSCQ